MEPLHYSKQRQTIQIFPAIHLSPPPKSSPAINLAPPSRGQGQSRLSQLPEEYSPMTRTSTAIPPPITSPITGRRQSSLSWRPEERSLIYRMKTVLLSPI